MANEQQKDNWDKANIIASVFASVLLPIILGYVGYSYTSAIQESENRVKYTELAISILKDDPNPSEDKKEIRKFAVELLKETSPVTIQKELEDELLKKRLFVAASTDSDNGTATLSTGK